MSINLKIFDLRCFIALCAHKNFTKAAEEMFISQPPFSRIIQKLEIEMRGLLIDRTTKSFALTSLGKRLLDEAQKIVEAYNNSMCRMEMIRNPKSEDLNIGFTPLVSHMPGFYELIDDLSQQASEVYLNELSSQSLCEKLEKHELDIGVAHFLPSSKSLKTHQIKVCEAAVLYPQQVCCFREKLSYTLILDEDKIDKPYNEYVLKNFPAYKLSPLYKEPTQLSPQLAVQGRGVLIYPEPIAQIINANHIFTLEEIDKSKGLFGIFLITQKNSFKPIVKKEKK
jgi:DNA-binding transcriptional LysR family regulator